MNDKEKVNIELVQGVEGDALYINNIRVWGNKPWGGALNTKFSIICDKEKVLKALGCI